MTLKWKDCRNPCKDVKFLIYALYVSKPRLIIYRFQIIYRFWIQ